MLTLVGTSYQRAPLELREAVAVEGDALPAVLRALAERFGGATVLQTCNRLELYVPGAQERAAVLDAFATGAAVDRAIAERVFVLERDREAVAHLYAVAAGIDSLVLGESEVLGQVRGAFSAAVSAGVDDALLSRLFHTAIRTGRRARTETAIGRLGLSVPALAVQLARMRVPELARARVLVLGAGEAGSLAARALVERGVGELVVVNRSLEHGAELAAALGGRALPLAQIGAALGEADIVIGAAAAPWPLVDVATAAAARAGSERPLLVIDVGVPRVVEPGVAALAGVAYYDLDALQALAAEHHAERAGEVARVRAIVDEEAERFVAWWERLRVAPTVAALGERAERLRRAELERTLRQLGELGERERYHVEALSRTLVRRLLHEPIRTLQERGAREVYVDVVRRLFALDALEAPERVDGEPSGPDAVP
ncbi:MAG: glutamyl-tRNA reductase [Chloroflexi bacterium]|nr:glutamyl-tRNA reductase [Chloroflexota bacterium]